MTKVEALAAEVRKLDRADLAVFRTWFRRYDSAAWIVQIEKDTREGKLDALAKIALSSHKRGKSRTLRTNSISGR